MLYSEDNVQHSDSLESFFEQVLQVLLSNWKLEIVESRNAEAQKKFVPSWLVSKLAQ